MPPRDDGGDEGEDGDDLGEARAPGATGDGRRILRLGFGLAPLALGHDVQAVDQARQAAQSLRQVFDGAATWRELAAATRSCVESLERRMGVKPPSQPQIFIGAAVTDLRIPGR